MFDQGVQNFDFDNYINGNNNTIDNNVNIYLNLFKQKKVFCKITSLLSFRVEVPLYLNS